MRLWSMLTSATLPAVSLTNAGERRWLSDHAHVIAAAELRPTVKAIPPQLREVNRFFDGLLGNERLLIVMLKGVDKR